MNDKLVLLGPAEVCELLGVNGNTLANWQKRGKFIEPYTRLKMGPVWELSQIEPMIAERIASMSAALEAAKEH